MISSSLHTYRVCGLAVSHGFGKRDHKRTLERAKLCFGREAEHDWQYEISSRKHTPHFLSKQQNPKDYI